MSEILHILFGAAFTVVVALSAGRLLLRRPKPVFEGGEQAIFEFLAGSACLSLAVFLLAVLHQARKGVFLWGGLAVIGWAGARALQRRGEGKQPPPGTAPGTLRAFNVLVYIILTAYFVVYFFHALAPEISPDGSGYHLGNVLRIWTAHGFRWDYHSLYSSLYQGLEMLFLVAYSFGGFPAAALVHLAFQTALPLLILAYGRRFGHQWAAAFAAVAVYASPVVGIAGASAYNDLAVATLVFAVFFTLQVWDDCRKSKLLILCGILVGFAASVKITAGMAGVFAAGFVTFRCRTPRERLHGLLLITLSSCIPLFPWVLRNYFWIGNPAAPFLNHWFPNPWYSPGLERSYLEGLRHYPPVKYYWQIFLDVIVYGGLVPGILGLVYLFSPVAAFSLQTDTGKRALTAAALMAVPALLNTEPRFWIPVLPFVALAMGVALEARPAVLAALGVLQAVACWPAVLSLYASPYAWRIRTIPVHAALRSQPPQDYIVRHISEYALQPVVDRVVPRKAKVFSFSTRPEAYFNRDIIVSYESSAGNAMADWLTGPLEHSPSQSLRLRVAAVAAEGVRVVQTASSGESWAVAELRIFSAGKELPRRNDWRIRARPNGWDVQLAFDNNYATRWNTWEPVRPGNLIEVDFGHPESIDEVALEGTSGGEPQLQLELLRAGVWTSVPFDAVTETTPRAGLRRAATLELKARGVDWLLINDSDTVARDMRKYPGFWGITLVDQAAGVRLYRID
jgi:hypothetical protein